MFVYKRIFSFIIICLICEIEIFGESTSKQSTIHKKDVRTNKTSDLENKYFPLSTNEEVKSILTSKTNDKNSELQAPESYFTINKKDPSTQSDRKLASQNSREFRPSPQLQTYLELNRFPVTSPPIAAGDQRNVLRDSILWKPPGNIVNPPRTAITFPETNIIEKKLYFYNYGANTAMNQQNVNVGQTLGSPINTHGHNKENTKMQNEDTHTGFYNTKNQYSHSKNQKNGLYNLEPHKWYTEYANSVHPLQTSDWTKVIKFLATFIPLGLLLTALKPTVVNVSSSDGTGRKRSEENSDYLSRVLLTSINYINKLNISGCEERITCELLLGATSVQHVENLLETYTERDGNVSEKINILEKIVRAMKNGSCRSLSCDTIQS